MTQPDTGPSTRDGIKAYASITDARLDAVVDEISAAVNEYVRPLPVAELDGPDPEEWPSRVVLGADMLAARLVRRRNSPAGVEAFADAGAVYVQRNDPDVAQLLELGTYAGPMVG